MRESQPEAEIPLQDTTAEAFTMLLRYIYTGRATLTDEKEEVLLDFLSLAHKYGFPELEDSTSEYLCTILNIQNVCMTFDVASLYSLPKLTCMCCMFMDRNAQEVLASDGFLSLSKVCSALRSVSRHAFLSLNDHTTVVQESKPSLKAVIWSSLCPWLLELQILQGFGSVFLCFQGFSGLGVVVYTFNPSTREAEAGRFLSLRPAWSTK
jgi:hypothetical protein